MPLVGGFSIGRWFGFPIRIDYSWFFVAALVVWTFTWREFPRVLPDHKQSTYLAMGTVAAALFFISVLLHELGHAVVARTRGITVDNITLFIFGGIAQAREEARHPFDEFLLTAAGPLTSLLLAGIFHIARLGAEVVSAPDPIVTVLGFLALLNFVLAVFNMIPGFPLDGGRIFRSIVWAVTGNLVQATRWAAWGGRIFGGILIVLGLTALSRGILLGGIWSILIGWFVVNAASTSFRHFQLRQLLGGIRISRVMTATPLCVSAESSLNDAIAQYFMCNRQLAYPVEMGGKIAGIIHIAKVAVVPEHLRDITQVVEIMDPISKQNSARPDETLADVLGRAETAGPCLLVLTNRSVVGLVDLNEIGTWAGRVKKLGLLAISEDKWGDDESLGQQNPKAVVQPHLEESV